jgi:hypothetical protein
MGATLLSHHNLWLRECLNEHRDSLRNPPLSLGVTSPPSQISRRPLWEDPAGLGLFKTDYWNLSSTSLYIPPNLYAPLESPPPKKTLLPLFSMKEEQYELGTSNNSVGFSFGLAFKASCLLQNDFVDLIGGRKG